MSLRLLVGLPLAVVVLELAQFLLQLGDGLLELLGHGVRFDRAAFAEEVDRLVHFDAVLAVLLQLVLDDAVLEMQENRVEGGGAGADRGKAVGRAQHVEEDAACHLEKFHHVAVAVPEGRAAEDRGQTREDGDVAKAGERFIDPFVDREEIGGVDPDLALGMALAVHREKRRHEERETGADDHQAAAREVEPRLGGRRLRVGNRARLLGDDVSDLQDVGEAVLRNDLLGQVVESDLENRMPLAFRLGGQLLRTVPHRALFEEKLVPQIIVVDEEELAGLAQASRVVPPRSRFQLNYIAHVSIIPTSRPLGLPPLTSAKNVR